MKNEIRGMRSDVRNILIRLLKEKAVKTGGPFILSSGKESDFYIDVRQVSLNGYGSMIIEELISDILSDQAVGIGGMEVGSIPVLMLAVLTNGLNGFYIKKESKDHGLNDRIVGLSGLPEGSKVCMVEDTTSSGTSLLEAIKIAQEAGLEVIQTITVVDRQEGATELLKQHGFNLQYLVNKDDLKG